MSRDKSKDDKYFNCTQEHEINYVAGLYNNSTIVKSFLLQKCKEGEIKYSTHYEVYRLIEEELNYPIPV